jgi:hypothetical protein
MLLNPSNSPSLQSIGIVTWIGLTNGEPAGGYPHQDIIYVTVIIGLGLLGALLLMFFWFVGIYLIGSTYFLYCLHRHSSACTKWAIHN